MICSSLQLVVFPSQGCRRTTLMCPEHSPLTCKPPCPSKRMFFRGCTVVTWFPFTQERSASEPVKTPGNDLATLQLTMGFSRCASDPMSYLPTTNPPSKSPELAFFRPRSRSLEVDHVPSLPGNYVTGSEKNGSMDLQVQLSLASIFSDLKNIGKNMQSMDSSG